MGFIVASVHNIQQRLKNAVDALVIKDILKLNAIYAGFEKCARNQKMERCNQCSQLHDCARLNTFSTWDSFIAHLPVINNLDKLNELGEDGFLESLRNAVVIKEYPPVPKSGSMTLGKLWGLIKPPYHPPQK